MLNTLLYPDVQRKTLLKALRNCNSNTFRLALFSKLIDLKFELQDSKQVKAVVTAKGLGLTLRNITPAEV